jgi:ATP-binding cassette, subfamily B, bacterial CvaB/MchF/RaxB
MSVLDQLRFGLGARLPMILQTEAAECGLACLAMVGSFHGHALNLAELRRRFAVSLKGSRLKDIMEIAERLGLSSRPLRLELEELPLLKAPAILHWGLNHFVVLKSADRTGVVIHDPGVGVRRLRYEEVSRHLTGAALELAPAADFRPAAAPPRVRLSSLLGTFVGLKRSLGHLLLLALAIEVLAVLGPFFLQWVVDHALITADRDLLLTLALGFALIVLLKVGIAALRGWRVIALGAALRVQGRSNLFTHLVSLPVSYFESRYIGDTLSRCCSQETILQALTTDLVEVVLDGLLAVVTLGLMFLYAPALAVAVVIGATAYALLRWFFYAPLRQSSAEAIVWGARVETHMLETLRGIKTIKLFNGQDERRGRWLNILVESVNRQLTMQNLRLLFRTANALLVGLLVIFVVWLGAHRVIDNLMSVGMLLAFLAYMDQFLDRVSKLIDKVAELAMLRLHGERLGDIALTPPEPADRAILGEREVKPVSVEVRNLRFRYGDGEPWVLDGVNLRVEAGETVAIVGPSGCGKTTLLKILASLLPASAGDILVDGEPLRAIGLQRWRSMIGVVMQDDQLFAGSIADNICFFSSTPDRARIEQCARWAAVHDDIAAMTMGYDSLIGDMGTVLSGGQKQRVLIARALYRGPSVLLLDEATSHLDVALEKAVSGAIRATRITRIIVAHRPETVRSTDRVISLMSADRDLPVLLDRIAAG